MLYFVWNDVLCFFFGSVLCFKTTDSLISANTKVYTYKCNCIIIFNTFNFFKHVKIAQFAGGPCMMMIQFMLCFFIYIYIFFFVLWSILWQNSINPACVGPTRCQIIGYCQLSDTTFADQSSYRLSDYGIFWIIRWHLYLNPLNAELNPSCKSHLAELFCGVFKFCA